MFLELNGQILVLVILAAAVVAGIVAIRHGSTWDDIQKITGERIAAVLPVLLILLSIGLLNTHRGLCSATADLCSRC